MHKAGASALTELLRFPKPAQRSIPCACGQQALYRELRTKPVLTAVGTAEVARPYYLCPHCHQGQFPADAELDIVNTEFSPGVRRMQALVGQDTPFDHGREQLKVLAGLEVTTKSVERVAETIGGDIARSQQEEMDRTVQLELPIVVGEPVPILYVQMDGTGVPVVKKETAGRKGKLDGLSAHTREAKLGCVFTQTKWDEEGFAIRDPNSSENASMSRPGNRAGAARKRRSSSAMAPSGSGIWPRNIFPVRFKSWTYIMRASTCGNSPACFIPTTPNSATPGSASIKNAGSIKVGSPNSSLHCNPSKPRMPNWPRKSTTKPTTSPPMPLVWTTPSSANSTYSSALALSKLAARPSSANALNTPACSGPSEGPTPSSVSLAAISTAGSRITGRPAVRLNLHFCVAHPAYKTAVSSFHWRPCDSATPG